ncbi:MAG: O-antigen ligase family protein [Candidatus Eisenbacteria sp.]|nr:O-antigen ligase family protein [Candidatus Eisenbacteria bacterium]
MAAAVIDLALLLLLDRILLVAVLAAVVLLALAWIARAEWPLAFLFAGMPLIASFGWEHEGVARVVIGGRLFFLLAWAATVLQARASGARAAASVGLGGAVRRAVGDPVSLAVLGLTLAILLGVGRSLAPGYGAEKVTGFVLGNVFFYFGAILLWPVWRCPGRLDRLLGALLIFGGLFVAVGLASLTGVSAALGLGPGFRGPVGAVPGRLAYLGLDPIWTARLLGMWIVLLTWVVARGKLPSALGALLAVPAMMLIVRTGSRGPLVALVLAPLALLLLLPRRSLRRHLWHTFRRTLLPAAGVAMVLFWVVMPEGERGTWLAALMRTPLGALFGSGELAWAPAAETNLLRDPSALYRAEIIRRAWGLATEALPWGAGTGSFPALLFLRDLRLYPHNIEAELLIEQGLPGLLFFGLFIGLLWRRAVALVRHTPSHAWLFVLFAMAFLNAQVSGDLGANAALWLWGGLIGSLWLAHRDGGRVPQEAG